MKSELSISISKLDTSVSARLTQHFSIPHENTAPLYVNIVATCVMFSVIASFQIPPLLIVAYFWVVGKFAQEIRELLHQVSEKAISVCRARRADCVPFVGFARVPVRHLELQRHGHHRSLHRVYDSAYYKQDRQRYKIDRAWVALILWDLKFVTACQFLGVFLTLSGTNDVVWGQAKEFVAFPN